MKLSLLLLVGCCSHTVTAMMTETPCGGGEVGNGVCPPGNYGKDDNDPNNDGPVCCSVYGWCGLGRAYCGDDDGSGGLTGGEGLCEVEDGTCLTKGECCSSFGFCGQGSSYCSDDVAGGGGGIDGGSGWGGDGNGGTCTCGGGQCVSNDDCPTNECCSQYGFCGAGAEHCDAAPIGGGECVVDDDCLIQEDCKFGDCCCSEYGFCGTGAEYCSGGTGTAGTNKTVAPSTPVIRSDHPTLSPTELPTVIIVEPIDTFPPTKEPTIFIVTPSPTTSEEPTFYPTYPPTTEKPTKGETGWGGDTFPVDKLDTMHPTLNPTTYPTHSDGWGGDMYPNPNDKASADAATEEEEQYKVDSSSLLYETKNSSRPSATVFSSFSAAIVMGSIILAFLK